MPVVVIDHKVTDIEKWHAAVLAHIKPILTDQHFKISFHHDVSDQNHVYSIFELEFSDKAYSKIAELKKIGFLDDAGVIPPINMTILDET